MGILSWLQRKVECSVSDMYSEQQEIAEFQESLRELYTIKASAPYISEPVIKLLNMLEEDVWEAKKTFGYGAMYKSLLHVYKEDLYLKIFCVGSTWDLEGLYWTTKDEREILTKAIHQVHAVAEGRNNTEQLRKDMSRQQYKQFLNSI